MSLKLFALVSLVSASAFAAEIKITSFVYSGAKVRAAEICGKVTREVPKMEAVQINVDPGNKVGRYVVWTTPNGEFCTTVTSYRGEATAELLDGSGINSNATATK